MRTAEARLYTADSLARSRLRREATASCASAIRPGRAARSRACALWSNSARASARRPSSGPAPGGAGVAARPAHRRLRRGDPPAGHARRVRRAVQRLRRHGLHRSAPVAAGGGRCSHAGRTAGVRDPRPLPGRGARPARRGGCRHPGKDAGGRSHHDAALGPAGVRVDSCSTRPDSPTSLSTCCPPLAGSAPPTRCW